MFLLRGGCISAHVYKLLKGNLILTLLVLEIIGELQYQQNTSLLEREYWFSKYSFLDKPLLPDFFTSDFVLEDCLAFWSPICWVTFIGRYPTVSQSERKL